MEKYTSDNSNVNPSNVANFSGYWNNSLNTGPFIFNVNETPDNTDSNIGTHSFVILFITLFESFIYNIFLNT